MTKFGKQNRSFNASVYNMYDWLEYSITNDAVYCFPCHNYNNNTNVEATLTFTKISFRNWKKASAMHEYFIVK